MARHPMVGEVRAEAHGHQLWLRQLPSSPRRCRRHPFRTRSHRGCCLHLVPWPPWRQRLHSPRCPRPRQGGSRCLLTARAATLAATHLTPALLDQCLAAGSPDHEARLPRAARCVATSCVAAYAIALRCTTLCASCDDSLHEAACMHSCSALAACMPRALGRRSTSAIGFFPCSLVCFLTKNSLNTCAHTGVWASCRGCRRRRGTAAATHVCTNRPRVGESEPSARVAAGLDSHVAGIPRAARDTDGR